MIETLNIGDLTEQELRLMRGLVRVKIVELGQVLPGSGFLHYENARLMIEQLTKFLDRIEG